MPIERDYSEISEVLIMITDAQDAEKDMRAHVREAKRFIYDRDGHWDEDAITKMGSRYRGTFDQVTPIVDGISGEIDQADFTLRVSPAGGDSSEDTAKTLDGLIRNIRNVSGAEDIFNAASRSNVVGGFDAVEVVTDWVDGNSFDQELVIRKVANAVDSVWFDLASIEQSRSDADWGVKLVAIPAADYKARWPEGGAVSVGTNSNSFNQRTDGNIKDTVIVGQLFYKKRDDITLVRLSDGTTVEDNEAFRKTVDELAQDNITIEVDDKGEEKSRKRKNWRVWSHKFDGAEWLEEKEETVFNYIPLIPIYGNFDIVDNICTYFGKIENLLDPQRALNYALSRDTEDGALSPAATTWMTDAQAQGNDYSNMNLSHDPVTIYNNDLDAKVPPFRTPGPEGSSGLQATIATMAGMITASSNTFAAQQGNASSTQSGIAGLQQIEQGNIGSIKWFKSLEIMVCQVGKVIINGAMPRVYDSTRQAQLIAENGDSSTAFLNKTVFDEESQTNIVINDLSIGDYDVTCASGPAFSSQQKAASAAFETMAGINPEMASRNMDLWLSSRTEPGMREMAERERARLFNAGEIPESQWTDEEREQVEQAQAAAAQQPPQPDPAMLIAQAEMGKAQAEQINAQNKTMEIQGNQQLKQLELQIKDKEINLATEKFLLEKNDKLNIEAAKIDQGDRALDQSEQQMIIDAQQNQDKIELEAQKQAFTEFKAFADGSMAEMRQAFDMQQQEFNDAVANLKTLREASGVDTIIGPHNTEAYINQAVEITELQEEGGVDVEIGEGVAGTE